MRVKQLKIFALNKVHVFFEINNRIYYYQYQPYEKGFGVYVSK